MAEQHAFQKQYFRDCTEDDDLYSESSDGTANNCTVQCNNDPNCGAFAVWENKCYFKNNACKNNIRNSGATLFLKQG